MSHIIWFSSESGSLFETSSRMVQLYCLMHIIRGQTHQMFLEGIMKYTVHLDDNKHVPSCALACSILCYVIRSA